MDDNLCIRFVNIFGNQNKLAYMYRQSMYDHHMLLFDYRQEFVWLIEFEK